MASNVEQPTVELCTSRTVSSGAKKTGGSLNVTLVQQDICNTSRCDDGLENNSDVDLKKQFKGEEPTLQDKNKTDVTQSDAVFNKKVENFESDVLKGVKLPNINPDPNNSKDSTLPTGRDGEIFSEANGSGKECCYGQVDSSVVAGTDQCGNFHKLASGHDEQLVSLEHEECDSDEDAKGEDVDCRYRYSSDYIDNELSEPIPGVSREKSASGEQFDSPEEPNIEQLRSGKADEERSQDLEVDGESFDANATSKKDDDEVKEEKNGKDDDTNHMKEIPEKVEKMIQTNVANIISNVYKAYKGCSCNSTLQTFFILTLVSQAFVSERYHISGLYDVSNRTFHVGQENVVYPIMIGNCNGFGLSFPEPNLPRRMNDVDLVNDLGINMRQAFANTSMFGDSDRVQNRINNNSQNVQVHNTIALSCRNSREQLGSSTEFISLSSAQITLTIREAEANLRGQTITNIRVVNFPALPSRHSLGLDEGNTDTKVRIPVNENITNLGNTLVSQDGGHTTAPHINRNRRSAPHINRNRRSAPHINRNRRSEIQTVGTYEFETISEIADRLSDSVSAQPAKENDDDVRTEEESMSSVQARARTFDARWPHAHFKPMNMASSGLYYTGVDDIVRCFSCGKCLHQWEREDNPFTEHMRHSPNCEYIQKQLQDNPQWFGASCAEVEENVASDQHYVRYRRQDRLNSRQSLEIERASGGYMRGYSRQMSTEGHRQQRFPHPEQDDHDDRGHEMILPMSSECQYSSEQESGDTTSHTGLTMFPLQSNAVPENVSDLEAVNSFDGNEIDGHINVDDRRPVALYHNSEVERELLLEGFSHRDIYNAVEAILSEDGIITVQSVEQMLNYMEVIPLP